MESNCREYVPTDLESLKVLMFELGYSVTLSELKDTVSEIYNQHGIIFVVEQEKKVVGCVCVVIDVRLAEGICAEIVSLVVSEEFRGQGLGKALVQVAENWATGRVGKIRVRTNTIRSAAHSFYKRQGFDTIKTQKVFIKKL